MSIVLDWNGQDLPNELKNLPAGRYAVQRLDDAAPSPEEEEGIAEALASLRRGEELSHEEAKNRIEKARGA